MRYILQIIIVISILIICNIVSLLYYVFYFFWEFKLPKEEIITEEIVQDFKFEYFYKKSVLNNFAKQIIKNLYL